MRGSRIYSRMMLLLIVMVCSPAGILFAQVPFEPGDFTDRQTIIRSNTVQKRVGYLFPDSNLVKRTWIQNRIKLNDSILYSETCYSVDGYRTKEITYGLNGNPRMVLNYNSKHQLTSKVVYIVNDSTVFGYVYLYRWQRKACSKVELYYGFRRASQLDSIISGKNSFPFLSAHRFVTDKKGNIQSGIPCAGSADTSTFYFHYSRFNELVGVSANDINHWSISFEYNENGSLKRYFGNGNPGISMLDDFYFFYDDHSLLKHCEIKNVGIVKYTYAKSG